MVSLTSRPWSIAPCAALGPIEQPGRRLNEDPEGKDPGPKESSESEGPKTIREFGWLCHLSYRWPKRALPACRCPQDGTKGASKPKAVVHAKSLCRGLRLQSTPKISPMFSMSSSDCRSAPG